MNNQNPLFFIKSDNNSDFSERSKAIFDQLPLKINEESTKINLKRHFSHKDSPICENFDRFKRQESIFKKPSFLPPRFRKKTMPAYIKSPAKWTKYTLDDVSQEDMSDNTNTKTALSFLQELANRKKIMIDDDEDHNNKNSRVVFKKPKSTSSSEFQHSTSSVDHPSNHKHYINNKLIMPEYIVGRSKNIKKQRKSCLNTHNGIIKLDHLDY